MSEQVTYTDETLIDYRTDDESCSSCNIHWPIRKEIIKCKNCKHCDKEHWLCNFHCIGIWDEELEADVLYRIEVEPDGFCWKGKRD